MDKIEKYYLDAVVISLLFQVNEKEKILKIQKEIEDEIFQNFQKKVTQYLLEKSLAKDQVEFISRTSWEKLPEEWQKYMREPGLMDVINSSVEEVNKKYYTEYFPKLSIENQDKIVNYIKNIEITSKVIEDNKDEIKKTKNDLFQEYNVNNFDDLIKKIYEEKAIKSKTGQALSTSPAINLGGVNTGGLESTVKSAPVDKPKVIGVEEVEKPIVSSQNVPVIPVELLPNKVEMTEPLIQDKKEEIVTQPDFGTNIVDLAAEPTELAKPEPVLAPNTSSNIVPVAMPGETMNINPVIDTSELVKEQSPVKKIMEGSAVVLPPVPPTPNYSDKSTESSSNKTSKYASFLDNTLPPLPDTENSVTVGVGEVSKQVQGEITPVEAIVPPVENPVTISEPNPSMLLEPVKKPQSSTGLLDNLGIDLGGSAPGIT